MNRDELIARVRALEDQNASLAGLLRSAVDALTKGGADAQRLAGVMFDCKVRARAVTVAWKQADDLSARLGQAAHMYGLGIPAAGQPYVSDPSGAPSVADELEALIASLLFVRGTGCDLADEELDSARAALRRAGRLP